MHYRRGEKTQTHGLLSAHPLGQGHDMGHESLPTPAVSSSFCMGPLTSRMSCHLVHVSAVGPHVTLHFC